MYRFSGNINFHDTINGNQFKNNFDIYFLNILENPVNHNIHIDNFTNIRNYINKYLELFKKFKELINEKFYLYKCFYELFIIFIKNITGFIMYLKIRKWVKNG